MGAALAELGQRVGLNDKQWSAIDQMRDRTPVKPMKSEE
jgi:hypothetical protein